MAMATIQRTKKVRILHQYHNNMLDTYLALSQITDVQFLSHRVSKLVPEIKNTPPKTWGRPAKIYNPWQLWNLLKNVNYIILKHINNPLNFLPLLFQPFLKYKIHIVIQQVNHKNFLGYNTLLSLLISWINSQDIKIIAVTKQGYSALENKIKDLEYIPAAIDASRFSPANLQPNNQLKIITVGKFQGRKQLNTLAQALSLVKQQHPRAKFQLTIIANKTSEPESVSAKQELENRIKAHKLSQNVTIIESANYKSMPKHYAESHLFILPAKKEPLGYSVVEAMAAGLPVLVSSEAGAASYVETDKNGYILSPKTAEAIASGITKYLSSAGWNWKKIQSHGRKSRKIAQQQHDPKHWVDLFNS